jgi:hypothetical protein
MTFGIVAKKAVLLGVVVAACGRAPNLETRTFRLQSLDDNVALSVIDPYVYGDRPNDPGMATAMAGVLTVRETADNLERIARVLEEFDHPRRTVGLHFQVILANGGGPPDPSIAEVEAELRRLFRFEGYRLIAEGSISGLEGRMVNQRMFDQRWTRDANSQMESRIIYTSYEVEAVIGKVSGVGDSAVVDLAVHLQGGASSSLFGASIVLGIGNTAVLGTLQLPGNEALILTVRAELAG